MGLLLTAVRASIDYWARLCIEKLKNGPSDTSQQSEQEAYRSLREAIHTDEQITALYNVVKDISVGVMSSFFDKIDEGVDLPGRTDYECQYYDIVDRETRESIITWSAHEEFLFTLPRGYLPFEPELSDGTDE